MPLFEIESGAPSAGVANDAGCHRSGVALQFGSLCVEGLRHEVAVLNKEEVPRRRDYVRVGGEKEAVFLSVRAGDVDAVAFAGALVLVASCEVEKLLTSRQPDRPAMSGMDADLDFCDLPGRASGGGDLE